MKQLPEQLEVPWRPRDAIVAFLLTWLILPVALLYLLKWTARVVPLAKVALVALTNQSLLANFVYSMVVSLLVVIVIYAYLRKYGASWRDLGLRRFNVGRALLYIALALGVFIVSVPIVFAMVKLLMPHFDPNQVQTNDFSAPATSMAVRISFLALVIVPPIIEEILFRGFIFPAFAKRWGTLMGAIMASALFGIAHLQANVGVYTIVLSLLLCWMYVRLRSIIPGIALHMINNYLAFYALLHK